MAKSDFKFAWPFRVRYSEVDGQMIVFNAHYLTYYDTAITEYFRA
ncbi:MAG: acyl-CoA thioesterase, partial [Pseudomonadota bacterium]|nr:acyl-CoA thioesterase [Pseudomonadota bacterium]